MFTQIDPETVVVTWSPPGPDSVRAAVGKDGVPRRWYSPELPSAWLAPWEGEGREPNWTQAKVYPDDIMLTDPDGGFSHVVPMDRSRLGLGDPAALDIVGAIPIPGRHEVAVTCSGSSEVAFFDYDRQVSEIVTLEGAMGGATPIGIVDGVVWFTNYNTLCRLDPPRTLRCSKDLQGPYPVEGYSAPVATGYIGRPVWAARKNGWLVPRPYSGDVLLVDPETLRPKGRILTGGRPFALHLFDDGAIVMLNDRFDGFQTGRLRDLRDL